MRLPVPQPARATPLLPYLRVALLAVVPTLLGRVPSADAAAEPHLHCVHVAAGPWTLLDSDLRSLVGTGVAYEVAYAGSLRPDDGPWVEASLGYYRAAGNLDSDPTFETGDAVLELIPITIGLRNSAGPDPGAPLRVYFGGALTWAVHRWDPGLGDSRSGSTVGAAIDLRPEIRVSPRLHFWLRQRFQLLFENEFGARNIQPSGFTASAGLRFDLRRGEE